jgi:hypothetical protein
MVHLFQQEHMLKSKQNLHKKQSKPKKVVENVVDADANQ